MAWLRWSAALLCLSLGAPLWGACQPGGPGDVPDRGRRAGAEKLIFFASWCPQCRDHLRALKPEARVLIVASFDERQAADEALAWLKLSRLPCIYDVDNRIARWQGVQSVPASRPFPATR